mmetsp:Transcript_12807/g.23943  ORF Transcript_12807/g.23943 Transcript_12807/m.23943 type:complete len:115 (-) Transcript_12807:134-478(-)
MVFTLTAAGGIASTLSGNQCFRNPSNIVPVDLNCTIVVNSGLYSCSDLPEQIPGSNLYFSCWACMISSMAVAFKWKESTALKFAQTEEERRQQKEEEGPEVGSDSGDDGDDGDD